MDSSIASVYRLKKTIVTTNDLALVWQETNKNNLKAKIAYYVKRGALIRLTRGIFAKDKQYDPKELATSVYTPAYISFETVLREAGIIFQHYDTVFVASKTTRTVIITGKTISFRKLKGIVLYNAAGISNKDGYSIATPERAFLDMIYLFPDYYFDNLGSLDWSKCFEIVGIYKNKQLEKRLKKYYNDHA